VVLYGLGCIDELSRECGCVGECGGHNPLWFNLSLCLNKSIVQVCIYVLLCAIVAYSIGLFIPVCHILTTLQDLEVWWYKCYSIGLNVHVYTDIYHLWSLCEC
jgi:hypothetical protein